jgi:hypothetical protein
MSKFYIAQKQLGGIMTSFNNVGVEIKRSTSTILSRLGWVVVDYILDDQGRKWVSASDIGATEACTPIERGTTGFPCLRPIGPKERV